MAFRILVAEDEESLSDLIKLNLELEDYTVQVAAKGSDALEAFHTQSFDLIILDVMLPEIDGFALCQAIRLEDQHVPILFLTAKNAPSDRVNGLRIGADDYLAKPFNLEEFLLRVQRLVKRGATSPEKVNALNTYSFGGNYVNFLTYEVKGVNSGNRRLSKKEIGLLKLLIERKNEVISRKEILDAVWGYNVYPSERTIDNFISSFRKYFEHDPKSPRFFHSVRGVGYKFTA